MDFVLKICVLMSSWVNVCKYVKLERESCWLYWNVRVYSCSATTFDGHERPFTCCFFRYFPLWWHWNFYFRTRSSGPFLEYPVSFICLSYFPTLHSPFNKIVFQSSIVFQLPPIPYFLNYAGSADVPKKQLFKKLDLLSSEGMMKLYLTCFANLLYCARRKCRIGFDFHDVSSIFSHCFSWNTLYDSI